MSCLGPNYSPMPPREWSRFENRCALNISPTEFRTVEMLKKGNILQYKKNSSNLTKKQVYSKIATGMWTNRTTTWATQTESYTNPNTNSLKRVGYTNIDISGPIPVPTVDGLTCSKPIIPTNNSLPIVPVIPNPNPPPVIPEQSTSKDVSPIIPNIQPKSIPTSIVIPDAGNLLCNISENICTGEIIDRTVFQKCYPTSDSDVPGPIEYLCYNTGLPTYYPKTKLTYGTSDNKWPQGAKFIRSAVAYPKIEIGSNNFNDINIPSGIPPIDNRFIKHINLTADYLITELGVYIIESTTTNTNKVFLPAQFVISKILTIINSTEQNLEICSTPQTVNNIQIPIPIYSTLYSPDGSTFVLIGPNSTSVFTYYQKNGNFCWMLNVT
jgi:hypothetical protein